MNRVAIIPARGGSKRLRRKNILDFAGKPILSWTVEAANETGLFDRVIVSTEDSEIAEIAEANGASVIKRSPALASDTARVTEVCFDVLDSEAANGRSYQQMTCLYATSPLRNADDIRKTIGLLDDGVTKFAMAVCQFDVQPVQALIEGTDGCLTAMWPTLLHDRSANDQQFFVDNGSTYVVDIAAFRDVGHLYGQGLRGHCMPSLRSTGINNEDDFQLALAKMKVSQ